jgi:hypothetical protein
VLKILTLVVVSGAAVTAPAAEVTLSTPTGEAVGWASWVGDRGPVAVLLWASWMPDAGASLDAVRALDAAAQAKGLELVVVSVQDDLEAAGRAIGATEVAWLHDRHGELLKHYRVVRIPALLVIAEDGGLMARLEPDAQALRAWSGE